MDEHAEYSKMEKRRELEFIGQYLFSDMESNVEIGIDKMEQAMWVRWNDIKASQLPVSTIIKIVKRTIKKEIENAGYKNKYSR